MNSTTVVEGLTIHQWNRSSMETNAPQFVVVIAAFNALHFLDSCLDSLSRQTLRDFEIILVYTLQCGEDRCLVVAKCAAFSAANHDIAVRLAFDENKLKPGPARNKAIGLSAAPWCAILDADDLWEPGKLQRVKEEIDRNPGVEFVFHGCRVHDQVQNRVFIDTHPSSIIDRPFERLLFSGNFVPHSSACYRRERFEATTGYGAEACEDWDLWLRMFYPNIKVRYLAEPLMHYVVHGNNLHRNRILENLNSKVAIVERGFQRGGFKGAIWRIRRRRALARLHFLAAVEATRNGDARAGRRYWWSGISWWPASARALLAALAVFASLDVLEIVYLRRTTRS
jgi:glycosyltransferase involved in cell wall biosynthesis